MAAHREWQQLKLHMGKLSHPGQMAQLLPHHPAPADLAPQHRLVEHRAQPQRRIGPQHPCRASRTSTSESNWPAGSPSSDARVTARA